MRQWTWLLPIVMVAAVAPAFAEEEKPKTEDKVDVMIVAPDANGGGAVVVKELGDKGDKPEKGDKGEKDKGERGEGRRGRGFDRQAVGNAIGDVMRGIPGGPGGPGGPAWGRGGNPMSREQMAAAVTRMAGVEVEGFGNSFRVDSLPLEPQRRFVTTIPVGGVDNLQAFGETWGIEDLYRLTEEQNKALNALREEYKAEQRALENEMTQLQKAMAEKLKEIRGKYELRANDVLTGADKESKEKLDALVKETHEKNLKAANDILAKNKDADTEKLWGLSREVREAAGKIVEEAQKKMLELVPGQGKAVMEDTFKQQAARREQMKQWMDRANKRENNGPPHREGEAVKPPKPPEENAGNF
jgi:hypothetical protein